MASLGEGLDEKIIHHDLDSVYTSYRWLEAMLLDDEMRISYSENGRKAIPGSSPSGGGRRLRSALGSRKLRPYPRCEASLTSASGTTTGSDGTPRSGISHPENISGRLSILSNQNLRSLLRLNCN